MERRAFAAYGGCWVSTVESGSLSALINFGDSKVAIISGWRRNTQTGLPAQLSVRRAPGTKRVISMRMGAAPARAFALGFQYCTNGIVAPTTPTPLTAVVASVKKFRRAALRVGVVRGSRVLLMIAAWLSR